MRVEVLGPVRLSTDEGVPVEVVERHLRLLLASLAASDGEPVPADTLVDRLWNGDLPANPKKVLQAKLSRLRTTLDRARPGARELLTHTPAGYRLVLDNGALDAGRFKNAVEGARRMGPSPQKVEALTQALAMWGGYPFGDMADEVWLAPVVAELHEVRGDALEALVETLVEEGDPQQALSQANGAIEEYPTRETLVGSVMLALYQVGRQHDALELFETLRQRLAEDLGVDPTPRTRELHGRILRQDPALAQKSAPEPAPGSVVERSNLPAQTNPMIGREHESRQIEALLTGSRLVTLTGIGGVGKTRLALHAAQRQAPHFERGTWFIDLTELTKTPDEHLGSGERVASLAATVVGLPEHPGTTSTVDRLSEALGARPSLLVLDNCEHVIAEAAVFTAHLLRTTPEVRVMSTSREPLGLPEEQRYDIGTLSTETGQDGSPSEAVTFFTTRAQASDPSFRLEDDSADAVDELCRRLDGLPLALELAATRVRGLSVTGLLDRLSERLNILRRPGHAAPRRQQTLRGMIDWSWSLLEATEQAVLRRLAVHPGTLSLDAAEAICADDSEGRDAMAVQREEVVDILLGLVDRSLVTTVSTSTGVRYGLLESIATYASEKLDSDGERDVAAERHLRYYLALAREGDQKLRGPQQRQWLPRLEAEHTQLRHAFDEAVRREDGSRATAMAVATFWHQWIGGRHNDLSRRLSTAITLPGPRDDTYATAATLAPVMDLTIGPEESARCVAEALALFTDRGGKARVQWFAGASLLAAGLREVGEAHMDEAVEVLVATGQDWDAAIAVSQRDWFTWSQQGHASSGLPDGRDPEAIIRASGDGYGMSQVLAVHYCAAEVEGDYARSAEAAERNMEICLDLGLWSEASFWLTITAIAALRIGDVTLAGDRLTEARSLASDIADDDGLQFADFGLALVARYQGDLVKARVLLDRWMVIDEPFALPLEATRASSSQFESGFLAVQEGDLARTRKTIDGLRDPIQRTARPASVARLLELTAALRAASGDELSAAELLGTAAAVRTDAGAEPSAPEEQDIQRIHERVSERLSKTELSDALAHGSTADPVEQLAAATQASPASASGH
ncbi:BTAD domain-containing putative transcriptional regulator [Nesterenkonia sp. CL21]|uniref:BTAD domain-containing putative transcriptional regulator n=1 Tax=Nesterenkonia sp. CL21 TaxID=3064894 RepID=UPI0028790171|nr:BTAD domain-containing putative transcriptional regulator [Nesterenkonia sp. CL21]MDS2172393.1 BTAD domain-containing putative transcriptional regulator [Nesterenkonia sp. CL21]